ncbi:zinc ribbon domain-containing protein [Haloferax mediterranei ATCC 33500]|nr:zinc ribbon domain-containing protein [Haloferax mediterranei]AHZ23834.1 hypothetical protein BM92_14795 [Haloferax mediterranei ATCC 33500]MDX5986771.1 zinc ribbon domain-containing protein [Haloferax mediterranei ATCC 33500]QCQ76096.1 zinc ribbon domain-containing protein [Haloferax mediterranei ATCC 33500]
MSKRAMVRPLIAAVLGIPIMGFGHLFLRRWRRALLWMALAVSVGLLFVPESARELLITGGSVPPLMDVLPLLVVNLVSVVDAFLLGMKQVAESTRAEMLDEDIETVSCPQCGREVDPGLGFCHWCTTRLDEPIDD